MDQDGGNGNGGQSARDFLALSHGHEWTNFYDSFDKLVQDNLARSSELLRHAMSLPEVADREVAQIKTEMAEKLKAERQTAKDAFASLHQAMLASQQQAEGLAASVATIVSDFGRLNAQLADLVKSYESGDVGANPEAVAVAVEPEPVEVAVESEPVAETTEDTWAALTAEEPSEAEAEEVPLAEAETTPSDDLGWDSDVSFDDVVGGDGEDSEEEDSDTSSSPQRPAWLSVARQSAAS